MDRVFAVDVAGPVIGFEVAVEGGDDGFGDIFACEAGASGGVARVEDDGGDLI